MKLESLLEDLIEKKTCIEELKKSSPEAAKAIELTEDYHRQYAELERRLAAPVAPTIVPCPYPVYPPIYPLFTWVAPTAPAKEWITITTTAAAGTTGSNLY